jgi:gliding motility-associated-like protein
MKYYAILVLLAGCPHLKGQNLVPNPSFEDHKRLPCDLNESYIQAFLENWLQPIPTTTDYWNNLSNPDCVLNPNNADVAPRTGNGMIGIIIAEVVMGFKFEYKEYIEVKLLQKLKKGSFYSVEFYAASQRNKLFTTNQLIEANNLGAVFSDTLISDFSSEHPDHLLMKPVVKESNIISANESWKKINGCFMADEDHQYLLIGNFDSIDSTKTRQLLYDDFLLAYYFIDDVKVQELPYKISTLVNTTTLCAGQASVELNAFVEGATGYQWENGSQASSLFTSVKSTKDYLVEISFNECTYKHKFHVEPIPDVALGADATLCTGEVLSLEPSHPINEYRWSDGSTDSVKYISKQGVYSVIVPSDDCTIQDSIAVEFIDCPGFIPNIITPNEDNHNEYFVFENIENRIWSLTVFNRWGEEVYFSEHYKNDWRGEGLSEGIYYYKILSKTLGKEVKGWVRVFR